MHLHAGRPDPGFWSGKRVLLTGHTGFKGAWLALWLHRLGAHVTGLALDPPSQPNLFRLAGVAGLVEHRVGDVSHPGTVARAAAEARPDVVLHLAAQALVRHSYAAPRATWADNLMGTVNVLEAVRATPTARAVVCVTTDKVYRNGETGQAYREDDRLGGHDPYSASKAACELAIASYRDAFLADAGIGVASARAGNVIGGGDWAADRLLPDAVRAWTLGRTLDVRRPGSVRPWQHVIEPLAGYLVLAERLWAAPADRSLSDAWNFGPGAAAQAPVGEVIRLAADAWGAASVRLATDLAGPHEAALLALDATKAERQLGVAARWDLGQAVTRTMRWYRAVHDGASAADLCHADLDAWEHARQSASSDVDRLAHLTGEVAVA